MIRFSMGWPPRAASLFGIIGERILLGKDEGGCGGVYTYMHHFLAGQIGYSEERRFVASFTDSRETMGECLDGFHHSVTIGTWI